MKMLVSDYDNTLYDKYDSECIKKNIEEINRFKENNLFTLATGRPYESIVPEILKNNIKYDYMITHAGNVIFDSKDTILEFIPFHQKYINYLLRKLNKIKNIRIDKMDYYGFPTEHNYETIEIRCIIDTNNFSIDENKKLLEIIRDANDIGLLTLELPKHNIIKIIFKENIHKAIAIEYLKNKLNLKQEDIYTIGDELNDREMLNTYNGFRVPASNEILKQDGIPEIANVRTLIKRIESE